MQTQAGGRAPGLVVGQFQVLVRIKAIETLINFPKKKKIYWCIYPTGGLHPTGLQGLCLPYLNTKERAWSWEQRHHQFNGWGSLPV